MLDQILPTLHQSFTPYQKLSQPGEIVHHPSQSSMWNVGSVSHRPSSNSWSYSPWYSAAVTLDIFCLDLYQGCDVFTGKIAFWLVEISHHTAWMTWPASPSHTRSQSPCTDLGYALTFKAWVARSESFIFSLPPNTTVDVFVYSEYVWLILNYRSFYLTCLYFFYVAHNQALRQSSRRFSAAKHSHALQEVSDYVSCP